MKRALLGLLLVGCVVARPASPSLPDGFPADFPVPPSAKLLSASGPLPFVPAEIRGFSVQWSSSLPRADLEAFYRAPHPGWRPGVLATAPPSLGPISLPATVLLTHVSDGQAAIVAIGMTNPIDSGTLVAVTITSPRPSPSP